MFFTVYVTDSLNISHCMTHKITCKILT